MKRSEVDSKCCICNSSAVHGKFNMCSKELQGKEVTKQPYREVTETLGVVKSTIWHGMMWQRKNGLASSATPKKHGRPQKTPKVNDHRILFLVKQKTLHNIYPNQEHSEGDMLFIVKIYNQVTSSWMKIQRV